MAISEGPKYGDSIEPIAIIGMAGRFPGEARSIEKFWTMISEMRTGHTPTPADRFDAEAWYHPNHERRGTIQPRSGFFLEESAAAFDAPFFSITAKEAAGMDPMQRKLLEVSYEAFENAGIPMSSLPHTQTGVYTGVMTDDYEHLTASDPLNLPQNAASGTSRAMLSNRVSWFFDLRGPSFTLDTACSSSLYALHLACQSLRLGESTQALVTGSNMILSPYFISQLSSMHMLSPDGISHSFDSRANGYARGEALGAVIVKTLSQALKDGDTIRAVIRGTGANQDGKTPGITMPSGESQQNLIRATYEAAGLAMQDTTYFEAHGTGTSLGDPIELGAIGNTFGTVKTKESPLWVNSVKTNVGHTEGAAGIAGVIKAVLSLERGVIPAVVGFEKLNPKLRLDDWNIALPLSTMDWPTQGLRRASVNSFGFGGANAHAILDDAYHYLKSHDLKGKHQTVGDDDSGDSGLGTSGSESGSSSEKEVDATKLFVFSSYDRAGTKRLGTSYGSFLAEEAEKEHSTFDIDDLAHTLAARRTHFDFRSYAVAPSLKDLRARLKEGLPKLNRMSRQENVIFVFTGQGAQWPAMGRELLSNPVFRASIQKSQDYLDELGSDWSVFHFLTDPNDARLNAPRYCQPVCSILQFALVDLLKYWGIQPKATVGHSSGELASAYAANLVRHKDAVRICYYRGVYCDDVKYRLDPIKGTMMAAGLSEEEAAKYLKQVPEGTVVVGCINSPTSVTLSGEVQYINELEEILKKDGKFARKLRVEVAYHSPHMQVVADDYLAAIGEIEPCPPSDILMFSSVTGEMVEDPKDLGAWFWMNNMISSVKFNSASSKLLNYTPANTKSRRKAQIQWSAAVEIGPHEALKGPFKQIAAAWDAKAADNITYTGMLSRGKHSVETAKGAAGLLWSLGHSIDLAKVNNEDAETASDLKVISTLPSYAWNHDKGFWHEPPAVAAARTRTKPRTDLLGVPVANQNPMEPSWRNFLRISECPWQEDHIITGTILYPGAGMLIMAIEAGLQLASTSKPLHGFQFSDMRFEKGLVVPTGDQAVETFLSVKPHATLENTYNYTVFSIPPGGTWTKHAWGQFALLYKEDGAVDGSAVEKADWEAHVKNVADIKARATKLDIETFYDQLQSIGIEYGPSFRNVTEAAAVDGGQSGVATIAIPDTKATMPHEYEYPHLIHPATMDAIFHLIYVAIGEGKPIKEAAIPQRIDKMFVSADLPSGVGSKFVGYSKTAKAGARGTTGDIIVSDEAWSEPKLIISQMLVTEVSGSGGSKTLQSNNDVGPKRVARLAWKEDIDSLLSATESIIREKAKLFPAQKLASSQLMAWLDLAVHKHADLNVLLLSSSSWADGNTLLNQFATKEGQRFRFRSTAIVASTAEEAEKVGQAVTNSGLKAEIKTVDITTATAEEIGALGTFDLIVAPSEFTSANKDVSTPALLQPLLSAGGRTALVGVKADSGDAAFDNLAEKAKDGQVAVDIQNSDSWLALASTPAEGEPDIAISEVVLLLRSDASTAVAGLVKQLTEQLSKVGVAASTATLADVESLGGKAVLSLLEVETPLVVSWTEEEFLQFGKLVKAARYLLWVTHGGLIEAQETSLGYAPSTGLLRTVRVETPQIVLPHLDLSPSVQVDSEAATSFILSAFKSSTQARVNDKNNEMEFAEHNGALWIPRAQADDSFDREIELHSTNVRSSQGLLQEGDSRRKLDASRPGEINSVRWIDDSDAALPLLDDDVEIQTSHIGLGASDVKEFVSNGVAPNFGRQIVGKVSRVGSKVTKLAPGQLVFSLSTAAFKTHVRQTESLVRAVPASVSSEAAASLPLVLACASYALNDVARFEAGESVFIDAAAGTLGQTLVQLAQKSGGQVFASVDSPAQKIVIMEKYGIPSERIFDSKGSSVVTGLASQTQGKGVDIIISSSTGVALNQLSSSLAVGGRFVDYSQKVEITDLHSGVFRRNVSFASINLDALPEKRLASLIDKSFDLLQTGSVALLHPTTTHSVSDLEKAVEEVLSKDFSGSTIVAFNEGALVPLLPPPPPELVLDPTASYVLPGGLGALGLTIADNLCEHGARHLIFLSRSGASNVRQQEALASFRERGCAADAIKCDVTDDAQMAQFAEDSKKNGWKIKGVIQCAMVLRDSIFENMTYDKWRTAVDPKIKGTWNLHSMLPKDLDFFVVLSSMSGIIGNTAQANYCAGNTYEDAVAHFRHKQGLAATTLNVGLVTDASHFNEDSTIEDYLKKYGHWISAQVTDRELQITLTAVLRGTTADGKPVPEQLLVGITDSVQRDDSSLNLWPQDRKFDHRISESSESASKSEESTGQKMRAAQTVRDAQLVAEEALRTNVANAMTASPSDIDVEKPLYSFGIDSLKAIEVRNWIFSELKCDISVFDVLSPTPLSSLALKIVGKSSLVSAEIAKQAIAEASDE